MSHCFSVPVAADLELEPVFARLDHDDLVVEGRADTADSPLFLYREGVSARPVCLRREGEEATVEVYTASALEDYALAREVASALAAEARSTVRPEDGPDLDPATFEVQYGDHWARGHQASVVGMLLQRARTGEGELGIQGTRREFRLGPRVLATLPEGDAAALEALIERIRRLNYVDDEDVHVCSILQVRRSGGTERLAAVARGIPTVVGGRPDRVALEGDDRQVLHVPFDAFTELVEDGEWLSEDTFFVPARSDTAWERLLEAARPLSGET